MTCSCGCCEGLHRATPAAVGNRPGLRAVRARIGTHGSFLETMLARLSSSDFPELAGLRTRDPGDPSVALLDGWAVVADVLTFYQERIANEGYLRTATERRSLVELARLIGYVPRPGVSASVYLSFGLEKDAKPVVIPIGTKANNIPGPGETMQAFETGEPLLARLPLGRIRPRLVQPQTAALVERDGLFLKGTATRLKQGDLLLFHLPGSDNLLPEWVASVEVDHVNERTLVRMVSQTGRETSPKPPAASLDAASIAALLRPTARAPSSAARLERSVASSFAGGADTLPQLLAALEPGLADSLYPALSNAAPAAAQEIEVYAMRIEARPFGHNAPLRLDKPGTEGGLPKFGEWKVEEPWGFPSSDARGHLSNTLYLDNDYEVAADTKVVIEKDGAPLLIVLPEVETIRHVSLNAYGQSGKSVELTWKDTTKPWLPVRDAQFSMVRSTRVFLGSERLDLADAPMRDDVFGYEIELDGLYEGLTPGRWLIVEGERTDIPDGKGDPIPGIHAAELVMLSGVRQVVRQVERPVRSAPQPGTSIADDIENGSINPATGEQAPPPESKPLPGDTNHTVITLAATAGEGTGLAYRYKRDTVVIHGNVARATHGETRTETLGSGNAAEALQRFLLKQPPLTYVSARTTSGIASTLELRVNDVLWHQAPALAVLGPADRKFIALTGDDDRTAVIFGDGKRGSRLPTGRENVKARYRSGIGAPGNVGAGQISLLGSRPLGVKDVVNPIRAAGGADREGANAIRRNAPIAIMALDRLLSTSDYADFARSFGGIGKASARRFKGKVEVVIAGVDDIPIDETSDVFTNLKHALHRFGDPMVPIALKVRERLSLIVKAGVRIDPDYLWEAVEPKVRAAMLAEFAFDAHELGAPLFLAQALRAIQAVRGVLSVDVDVFDKLSVEDLGEKADKLPESLAEAKPRLNLDSDQIAYLSSAVPDTLILQELPS